MATPEVKAADKSQQSAKPEDAASQAKGQGSQKDGGQAKGQGQKKGPPDAAAGAEGEQPKTKAQLKAERRAKQVLFVHRNLYK